jgi:hypothetical protein
VVPSAVVATKGTQKNHRDAAAVPPATLAAKGGQVDQGGDAVETSRIFAARRAEMIPGDVTAVSSTDMATKGRTDRFLEVLQGCPR